MSTEAWVAILGALAIAGASVWAVEQLAEQRSRRDRQLEAIDQTSRQMVGTIADVAASLAGEGATKPGSIGADAYPKADAQLVGDIQALRTYYGILAELHSRAPGSGFRKSDGDKAATAQTVVRTALAAQEKLVHARKRIRKLTPEEVASMAPMLQGVVNAMVDTAMADDVLQGRVRPGGTAGEA